MMRCSREHQEGFDRLSHFGEIMLSVLERGQIGERGTDQFSGENELACCALRRQRTARRDTNGTIRW
jgi:hypothetical protein